MLFVYAISIISGILFGATESLNKYVTEEKYSAFSYSFIQNFSNFLLYFVPFLLTSSLPRLSLIYLYLPLISLLVVAGNVLIIRAYKVEDISSISIVGRVGLIVSFLMGTVFLSEVVTVAKIIGLALIIFGIIVIFYQKATLKPSLGLGFALLGGMFWGITPYFTKLALKEFTPLAYSTFGQLTSATMTFILPAGRKDIYPILKKYKWKILLSRLFAVLSIYAFIWSVSKGQISIINTNNEVFFLLSTVFIGILLLKEKNHLAKKFVGTILCILGIVFLNLL